ncbi:MAG TPA: hypothetical protein VFE50_02520 [Cyclobacteriaceae bacterium]|nr:hypothetical protein [Cyclobacteriaceae bacterium]
MLSLVFLFLVTACERQVPSSPPAPEAPHVAEAMNNGKLEEPDQVDDALLRWSKVVHGSGVVVARIRSSESGVFTVLNENQTVFMTMDFGRDSLGIGRQSTELLNQNEVLLSRQFGLHSRAFYPEYGIVHFDCLEVGQKYYKVTLGETPDKVKKIAINDGKFEFLPWQDYILRSKIMFEVGVDSLWTRPSGDQIKILNHISLQPLKVEGDWVQVKCDDNCSDCNSEKFIGWIRWRDKERLLIKIGLLC